MGQGVKKFVTIRKHRTESTHLDNINIIELKERYCLTDKANLWTSNEEVMRKGEGK